MSRNTAIEWTDHTWPVVTGCDYSSMGCIHCYAVPASYRMAHNPNPKVSGPYAGTVEKRGGRLRWTGRVNVLPERLDWPLRWRKPARIFVANMGDLFHESVPDEFILQVFDVMRRCTWAGGQDCGRIGGNGHTFQVLTKRAARMAEFCSRLRWDGDRLVLDRDGHFPLALPLNDQIWLGVSTEDQETANERIPHLLRVPAAVRFLSCEPLLGPIRLRGIPGSPTDDEDVRIDPLAGRHYLGRYDEDGVPDGRIAWVIAGGESGPHARPCDIDWIRSVVRQCRDAGIPAYVKQLGAHVEACDIIDAMDYFPGSVRLSPGTLPHNARVHLRDPKGGDIEEFPADLRVREFPVVEPTADA